VVPGWASIIISIYFIGGVQLLCFGILGEYIGKLYQEVKDRPRYFIELEI
jgi:glycosyltransferase involved in cell wall biosynthesis